jgi:hypothetical protein
VIIDTVVNAERLKNGGILLRKWLSDGRPGWGYAALGTSMTS